MGGMCVNGGVGHGEGSVVAHIGVGDIVPIGIIYASLTKRVEPKQK